jgi:hypothetical protein
MYMIGGLFYGMATMFALIYFGHRGLDTFLRGAEITIAISLVLPILLNIRRPFKRMLKGIATSLYSGVLFGGMFVFIGAMQLSGWWADAPTLQQFAQADFAKVDSAHTGVVTTEQLQRILDDQAQMNAAIADLQSAQKAIDATSASNEAKQTAKDALAPAEKALQAKLLPSEEVTRIFTANHSLYEAGHQIKPATGNDRGVYAASVDELTHFRETIQSRYPQYFWMFRTVHYKL